MKKHHFLFIGILFLYSFSAAQSYREDFIKHLKAEDSTAQMALLTKWEQEKPDDPALFVSYFNHYFMQGKEDVLTMESGLSSGDDIQVQDSSGDVKGFIGSTTLYDSRIIDKGIVYINKGIAKYPSRLDMRFGKIFVYGQMENWEGFTTEIMESISYSDEIKNQWTWSNGDPLENSESFFLSALQTYQIQLFDTEKDSLLGNMRRIANHILTFYPDHIPSLSNLSITYLLTEEYEKGLEPLLKAKKLDPKDAIVLSNIARIYVLKEDNKKAIKYYKKVLKYGEGQTKEFAEEQIEVLKKR